jgi:glycyl-tRNA synthetase beta chain
MLAREDLLLEIHTEELPAQSLEFLASALARLLTQQLQQAQLTFSEVTYYATPRRLAVIVTQLAAQQSSTVLRKKGPALSIAYDANGQPTAACLGFARSCGVTPSDLRVVTTKAGKWLEYHAAVTACATMQLLPALITQALADLPIAKPMRWGQQTLSFVRPVHGLLVIFANQVVPMSLYGVKSSNFTYGHRFHHPQAIYIDQPQHYQQLLHDTGQVIVAMATRQAKIVEQAEAVVAKTLGPAAQVLFAADLLTEITGLVEWPIALCGSFAPEFLTIPAAILIAVMQKHQRYFPVVTTTAAETDTTPALQPYYVTITNIDSNNSAAIIAANNQVLQARLADAAFFIAQDQQQALVARVDLLQHVVFHEQLGSLFDKTMRIQQISAYLANCLAVDGALVARAALLAKADLTTTMVAEFPELQGIVGEYYALHDQEDRRVAVAIATHYYPRHASDQLPNDELGVILAIAERLDTIVGLFGVQLIPTGDKDPYALRRAALGVIRIIIANKLSLNLLELLHYIVSCYAGLVTHTTIPQVLNFIEERFKHFMHEQGIAYDIIAAVTPLNNPNFYDRYQRLLAVHEFNNTAAAVPLIQAHKRITKILAKNANLVILSQQINTALLTEPAEIALFLAMQDLTVTLASLKTQGDYHAMLRAIVTITAPINDFFAQVLVMTAAASCANRLLLLQQLRELLLTVADFSCLTI